MSTETDLATKRAALVDRLAAMRTSTDVDALVREANAALSAHKSEAAVYEAQIAELDAELGLRERDKRDAAARQYQAQQRAQRQALLEEEGNRLQAIADAESATRALVDAITRMLAANAKEAKLVQQLSVSGKVPSALSATELVSRTALRHASLMMTIEGHRFRFGPLAWPGGASGLHPAERNWRDDEEAYMAKHVLQPLLEQKG